MFEHDLEALDIVWARVSSDQPVGLNFAAASDYEAWAEDGECDLRAGEESVFEASIDDVIEDDDAYVLWIDADSEDAKVTLDLLIWRVPESDDDDD